MLCSCCHPRPNQPQVKIQSPWMLATDFQHQTLLRCLETWWRTWVWKKALLNSLSNLTRSGIKGWRWREKIGSFLKKPRTHVWCGEVICPHMVGWKLTMFRLQAWLSQHLSNIIALHHPGCQDHYCEHTVCQGRFAGCQKFTLAHRWMTAKNYKHNQVQRLNWCQLRVATEIHLTAYWLPLATQERGIDVAKLDEWGQQMQEQVLGHKWQFVQKLFKDKSWWK